MDTNISHQEMQGASSSRVIGLVLLCGLITCILTSEAASADSYKDVRYQAAPEDQSVYYNFWICGQAYAVTREMAMELHGEKKSAKSC